MRALICGISGQDGAYLAQLLLKKGYAVTGTSRNAATAASGNLSRLGILNQVQLMSMPTHEPRGVLDVLRKTEADEIYNLSGQSSVGMSFEQPAETLDSIIGGNLNILEAIRALGQPTRFYNAGSGECFGETPPAGPMRSQRQPHSGWSPIIATPMVFTPVPASFSIMNHR